MNRLKVNWFIVFWGVALITVLYLHFFYHTPEKYMGIVETKSHLIGVQEPGTVENILVSIGENVKKGQVLVTLYFSDLETEINQLRDELTGIQKLKKAHQDRFSVEFQRTYLQLENEVSELTERLAILEAKRTELTGLNAEIERLKGAEEAGLGHTRDLADLIVQRDAIASYLREQSEELQLRTQKLDKTRQTRQVLKEADTDGIVESMLLEPMERAQELRRAISLIEHRIQLRTLFAPCDGHVVEMFAHPGDVVDEFIPILSVEESNPRYLTVYIPEKSDTHIEVGMQVRIYSPRLKRHVNPGVVTFINPGFSQTTERLWLQGQIIWARMVRVELEDGHELLPGEKVLARVDGTREHRGEFTLSAQATEARAQGDDNQNSQYPSILRMELSQSLLETSRFEPSGIAWLENFKKFVIVSDDTGIKDSENDHAPWVFLMDEEGHVETTPVVLEGIDTVNDLEAIAPARNGIYYLISSQNTSKRGKRPMSREMILKVRQHNKTFQVQGKVSFLSIIIESHTADQLKALGLGEVAEDGRPVLNIEGAAWWKDVLYLGLKSPVGEKGAIIWKLNNPTSLFEDQKLKPGQLSVYGYVQLGVHKDRIATLSDLAFDTRGVLWALSTIADAEEGDQMGGFHRIDRFADDHLEANRIMRFPGLKPEGICVLGEDRFLIVFDEDRDIPSFCTIAMEDL